MAHVTVKFGVSERRACRILGQPRSTQRRQESEPTPEDVQIMARVIELALQEPSWGYREITDRLRMEGWVVNPKRIDRICRQEGLRALRKKVKRGRLRLIDGTRVRLRPQYRNHVWAYDFVEDQTSDGRKIRMLVIVDEFSRECLAIRVARRLQSPHVLEVLYACFSVYGVPEHLRSDNGPEFIAERVRTWLGQLGVKTLFIEPGSPWENGFVESLNGTLREECLSRERFDTLFEAQVLVENWRQKYNTFRPHSSLGGRPPAPEVRVAWPLNYASFRSAA